MLWWGKINKSCFWASDYQSNSKAGWFGEQQPNCLADHKRYSGIASIKWEEDLHLQTSDGFLLVPLHPPRNLHELVKCHAAAWRLDCARCRSRKPNQLYHSQDTQKRYPHRANQPWRVSDLAVEPFSLLEDRNIIIQEWRDTFIFERRPCAYWWAWLKQI